MDHGSHGEVRDASSGAIIVQGTAVRDASLVATQERATRTVGVQTNIRRHAHASGNP